MIRPQTQSAPVRVLFPSRSPYADLESVIFPPRDEDDFPAFLDEQFLRYELPAASRVEVSLCL